VVQLLRMSEFKYGDLGSWGSIDWCDTFLGWMPLRYYYSWLRLLAHSLLVQSDSDLQMTFPASRM
jgi:hypothetical protein